MVSFPISIFSFSAQKNRQEQGHVARYQQCQCHYIPQTRGEGPTEVQHPRPCRQATLADRRDTVTHATLKYTYC
jgi:hypothetical protein